MSPVQAQSWWQRVSGSQHLATTADWFLRVAAVNLCWLGASLIGLVVAGVGPASVAACAALDESTRASARYPGVWRSYWRAYRRHWWSAQAAVTLPLLSVIPLAWWAYELRPAGYVLLAPALVVIAYAGFLPAAAALSVDGSVSGQLRLWLRVITSHPLSALSIGLSCLIGSLAVLVLSPAAAPVLLPTVPLGVHVWVLRRWNAQG